MNGADARTHYYETITYVLSENKALLRASKLISLFTAESKTKTETKLFLLLQKVINHENNINKIVAQNNVVKHK